MARKPWMKFYPADWQSDEALRMCSFAARGLWVELLALAHKSETVGHVMPGGKVPSAKQLAILCGGAEKEISSLLSELRDAGVYDVGPGGVIVSRRMIRDAERDEKNKSNGANGGNPDIRRGTTPKDERVRPYRRSDSTQKTKRIFDRSGGKCHWCGVELYTGPDLRPNTFHVDHVIPVCDGGTNDEGNLVAACASCNHERARKDAVGYSASVTVGNQSDTKAQWPLASGLSVEGNSSLEVGVGEGGLLTPGAEFSFDDETGEVF